jgi:glycine/D-amino acid oxidase-like deaminating enzyme
MPLDGFPAIGFCPSVANAYIAVMHSGVTLAPLVAELASMELLDGIEVSQLNPYRPGRLGREAQAGQSEKS